MKTIKTICGVDCKIGRNSRTGSTISLTVPDSDIIDVVQYFNDFKAGKEPSGNIKKIELIIYGKDEKIVELPDTKELDETLNTENDSHQGSLNIFEKQDPCENCIHRSVGDSEPCNLECKYNPKSKSKIDLFEVIPMSQRL